MATVLPGTDSISRIIEGIAGSAGSEMNLPTAQKQALPLGGLIDDTGGSVELAGEGALLQPIFDAENNAIIELHREMVQLGTQVGTPEIMRALVKFGESVGPGYVGENPNPYGPSNLVTDLLNAPSDLLAGDVDGLVAKLGGDLDQALEHAQILKDSTIFTDGLIPGSSDPTNPIPELLESIGHDISNTPLLTINGGNTGGLLNGVVGDISHSPSGHLIDIDIGPSSQDPGLVFDVLSAAGVGPSHGIELNVIDVGPGGPTLANLDVLTGGNSQLPLLNGAGADSLVGDILGTSGMTNNGSISCLPSADIVPELIAEVAAAIGGEDGNHNLLGSLSHA